MTGARWPHAVPGPHDSPAIDLDPEILGLSSARTLVRNFVHKRAVEQVFVTDVKRVGGRMLAMAQLPRTHRLYNDSSSGGYDLLLLSETARQATEAIVHCLMNVPLDRRFVMGEMRIELRRAEALAIKRAPVEVVMEFVETKARRRSDGTPRQLEGSMLCYIDGLLAAEFTGSLMILMNDEYQAFRGQLATSPPRLGAPAVQRAQPEQVGKYDPRNVVIGASRAADGSRITADLVVDPGDPVFFDHELDHFPAMLILEGARQSAVAAVARLAGTAPRDLLTTACSARFLRFMEFDVPVICSAFPAEADVVSFELQQHAKPVAAGEVRLAGGVN